MKISKSFRRAKAFALHESHDYSSRFVYLLGQSLDSSGRLASQTSVDAITVMFNMIVTQKRIKTVKALSYDSH